MNKEQFEAIIKEVNEAKCDSVHAVEVECDLFYEANPKMVKKGMNVDKHRWYEISTCVYLIGEWYLGVCGVSDLFSESMGYDDCNVETNAFEMEQVQSVTYIQKKDKP